MKKIVFVLIAVLSWNAQGSVNRTHFKKEAGGEALYEFMMNSEVLDAGKHQAFDNCYSLSRRDLIKQEGLALDRRIHGGIVCADREQPIIVLL